MSDRRTEGLILDIRTEEQIINPVSNVRYGIFYGQKMLKHLARYRKKCNFAPNFATQGQKKLYFRHKNKRTIGKTQRHKNKKTN